MKPTQNSAELTPIVFATELGWMAAAFRGPVLVQLSFGHRTRDTALQAIGYQGGPLPRSLDPTIQRVIERLTAFAAGYDDDLREIAVDYGQVTPFQRRVLDACRAIPRGETLTYAQLATVAGAPGAARAVGNVMRSNRLPLVVPCHRVVGSGGSLGGYSAPEGLTVKRRLLEREGALASC